jgi:exonuclease SbcD
MKIAITADVHLTGQKKNPERYQALINILDQLVTLDISNLIIAGDLFDKSCEHPGELEEVIRKPEYEQIKIYIIPGNHDPVISKGAFTLPNIDYVTQLKQMKTGGETSFLFVPYQSHTSIGEVLAACQNALSPNQWILVAHGDYLAGSRLKNSYEDGLYMPLSGRDLQVYQPRKVFIGHIHVPYDSPIVHYPGSPCGLDITETGVRSFIIYDTERNYVERQAVTTDVIYMQESLTVLPMEDEEEYVRNLLAYKLAKWDLDEEQRKKVRLRLNLQGYSTNRERLLETVITFMDQNGIVMNEKPDLNQVKLSNDVTRAEIAMLVQKKIVELAPPMGEDEPNTDEYVLSAMSQIYKG